MSCLNPLQAWQDRDTLGRLIFSCKQLDPSAYYYDAHGRFISARYRSINVPCGKCILCRKSRAWEITVRAIMEYKALDRPCGCFATLTVDDEHMSDVFPDGKLRHKPFQDFIKRLRRKVEREYYSYSPDCPRQYRKSLRYLMCGEFGEHTRRPHYHVCFFGLNFVERPEIMLKSPNVDPLGRLFGSCSNMYADRRPGRWYADGTRCESTLLQQMWPYGHVQCRALNDHALAYVAGYQLKLDPSQVSDDNLSYADWWSAALDEQERFYDAKMTSYVKWSRMPGLGYEYMRKYPDMFRLGRHRCDDGYTVPVICPTIIYNGRQVYFDGRYFKTKLSACDRKKYDIMSALAVSKGIADQDHSTELGLKMRAANLTNKAARIELKLAGKRRDLAQGLGGNDA